MPSHPPITFAGATLDRAGHLRNASDQARLRADPVARTAVIWRGKALFEGQEKPFLRWLPLDAPILSEAAQDPVFLGLDASGAPHFAHDISTWEDPDADTALLGQFMDTSQNRHPAMRPGEAFLDIRANMGLLSPEDAAHAATARGVFAWHQGHGFCARCGHASDVTLGGWQRTCPACKASHFPRTDPVVIMLVTHGQRVLLGRSPGWPDGMFSLLAGFMEPGETIEAAVRRETFEESGISVGEVGYMASQPWPFPASLMIGCWGHAQDERITLDPAELEQAIWATKDEIRASLAGNNPALRPARKGAIARTLIERWLAED
ncbi:NAD(+) diphosphatase [Algicella marina]|uniref:NAD(+) diphosphatase n=1 Tax=Algicella marina TaxID=2683284 RepID=A0A6P1SXJ0_9RHOB|nr:NAD(+) diphosphatase [Algicella marina]QHQ33926.1 NAD(+) diphosphatase [Algicella marina]